MGKGDRIGLGQFLFKLLYDKNDQDVKQVNLFGFRLVLMSHKLNSFD